MTGKFLPAESFHLVFGYENQSFREHARVAAYHVANAYDPSHPYQSLAYDWALLSITASGTGANSRLQIQRSMQIDLNSRLATAGYSYLVPYAMTADRGCKIIGRSFSRRLFFDNCRVPAGYSGGPVLTSDGGKIDVIGIHVANQTADNRTAAVAVSTASIWPEIKSCLQELRCNFNVVAKGKEPRASEILARTRPPVQAEYFCDPDNPSCVTLLSRP
jgi:hypothetical protein